MAAVIIMTSAAAPTTFAGLVYYSRNWAGYETGDAAAINGAAVRLYKYTANGWEAVARTDTDTYGYYHFDDVDTSGVSWFKVHVDATDLIPDWENDWWVQERAVYNAVRPEGLPDAGIIRVDVLYVSDQYLLLASAPEGEWHRGFEGHFVRFITANQNVMPNMGMGGWPLPHTACYADGTNEVHFLGCFDGHWYSATHHAPLDSYWTTATWVHYKFYEPVEDPPGEFWGEGYYWWDPAQPWYVMTKMGMADDLYKEEVDFVGKSLPE